MIIHKAPQQEGREDPQFDLIKMHRTHSTFEPCENNKIWNGKATSVTLTSSDGTTWSGLKEKLTQATMIYSLLSITPLAQSSEVHIKRCSTFFLEVEHI